MKARYFPFMILQKRADTPCRENERVPDWLTGFPSSVMSDHVFHWSACRGDFFDDSHGLTHFQRVSLQIYPADQIHPWMSRSDHTTVSSQAHGVIVLTLFPRAIQAFENVCLTGSHGAVIHWTCTVPQTGAYSWVHMISSHAETVRDESKETEMTRIQKKKVFIKRKSIKALTLGILSDGSGEKRWQKTHSEETRKNAGNVHKRYSVYPLWGEVRGRKIFSKWVYSCVRDQENNFLTKQFEVFPHFPYLCVIW